MIVGIIPAYKPDEKLRTTVDGCVKTCENVRHLIVVDDGSGFEYEAVFKSVADIDARVEVLHLGVNSGMGAAIKAGMQYALHAYPDVQGFVVFDADGQHHPEDVRRVVSSFLESQDSSAFVIGVREYHDPCIKIPFRSRFGNRVTEAVFWFCTGVHLPDTQSGLRLYSRNIAERCTQIEKNRYEFQQEALILAVRGARCIQVPIRTIYEDNNRRSHFRPILDSVRIYSVFLRFAMASTIGFIVDYLVFAMTFSLSDLMAPSLAVSCVCGYAADSLAHRFSVFCQGGKVGAARRILLALVFFAVSYGGIFMLHSSLRMHPLISKLVVDIVFLFFVRIARKARPASILCA